jgi:hypothetical protein
MPISEGFEGTLFPPNNWLNYDGGGDSIVWKKSNYGGFGNSSHSMFFDNYSYNESGKQKSMEFATDLTHYDSLQLSFDVAYQTLQNYSDSLEVTLSPDCGQTFQQIYLKGGNTLATAPHLDSPSAAFFPSAAQWRTEIINLAAYSHLPSAIISFNNISGYGTYLYVDNINLRGAKSNNTGINNLTDATERISFYPNPSSGVLTLSWYNVKKDQIVVHIYDLLGKKVKEIILAVNESNESSSIDVSDLTNGIYIVKTKSEAMNVMKLTIQK